MCREFQLNQFQINVEWIQRDPWEIGLLPLNNSRVIPPSRARFGRPDRKIVVAAEIKNLLNSIINLLRDYRRSFWGCKRDI